MIFRIFRFFRNKAPPVNQMKEFNPSPVDIKDFLDFDEHQDHEQVKRQEEASWIND